jgi:integrase
MRAGPADSIGQAMDAAGLNTPDLVARHGRATPHSLRHTFASWLVQNGAELHESGALGHSSVSMTQRYAHLSKSATVAKLGGILTNMPPTSTAVLPDVKR